ncbi:type IV pilus modification protein PilV [Pseudomonas sp. NY15181]|uniref:type IV pilus modification protein PilV n=1 Tax=Pseudomonas sp. NY15181 TaxID=3400349 RepID=UPI003A876034
MRGFTLIEVLVAMLVLAIGLLGLAGLQSRMLNSQFETYQRAQALMLAEDMANRIRSNPAAARSTSYVSNAVYGVGNTTGDGGCSSADVVGKDLCAWNQALKGASVTTDDNRQIGSMIGARGCISTVKTSAKAEAVIRVSVAWMGTSSTVSPADACGKDSFGSDDSMRRAIYIDVTLAYLGV